MIICFRIAVMAVYNRTSSALYHPVVEQLFITYCQYYWKWTNRLAEQDIM